MSEKQTVDARGLSCPQPVMLTRDILKKTAKGIVEVLVDSGTARDNVSRLAKSSGWSFKVESQQDGVYKIVLNK
jgi:tRNA 2-thiouridine synthesizing protein A